jgi:hypothetical protein
MDRTFNAQPGAASLSSPHSASLTIVPAMLRDEVMKRLCEFTAMIRGPGKIAPG